LAGSVRKPRLSEGCETREPRADGSAAHDGQHRGTRQAEAADLRRVDRVLPGRCIVCDTVPVVDSVPQNADDPLSEEGLSR